MIHLPGPSSIGLHPLVFLARERSRLASKGRMTGRMGAAAAGPAAIAGCGGAVRGHSQPEGSFDPGGGGGSTRPEEKEQAARKSSDDPKAKRIRRTDERSTDPFYGVRAGR